MEERMFENLKIKTALLGFGAMRLPLDEKGGIDKAEAEKMLDLAYEKGVTYYDTAYTYHGGESEPFLGAYLKKYQRSTYQLATKLPQWLVNSLDDAKRLFEEQLARLGHEYIDFYLIHAIDKKAFVKMVDLGVVTYLEEEQKQGRIKHLGFSFHSIYEDFEYIASFRRWDFCQIQYNYAQHDIQAGTRGLQYAHSKGIGVAIMEPLFGGFLTGPQMPPGASQLFEENGVNPVAGALRWIWNQPEPAVVLSGMSEKYQVKENLRIVETADVGVLTERERQVLEQVCRYMRENVPIPCSKCGYCLKSCPVGIKIPVVFDLYNKHLLVNRKHTLQPALYRGMLPSEKASACIRCGACKKHCPQSIDIPAWLEKVAAEFEGGDPA